MQIEIEKKYSLTDHDYEVIKQKCHFEKEVILKDYYLDKDFILANNNYYLRLRNGLYELKIVQFNAETKLVSSEEYTDEDEINIQLNKIDITTDDVTGIMFIDTHREKYSYIFKEQQISIDVERYQYGTRYEIEITYNEKTQSINREKKEIELNTLIEGFREDIGLTAQGDISSSKCITVAMHQNIELYEIMTQNIIQ